MSTVLDVGVCLLLVTAAATTLAVGVPESTPPDRPDAATTAERISTVTATVAASDRTAHDTLAGHLATAAVANGTVAGRPLAESRYPDAVREVTTARLPDRTHVTARWRVCENGPVSGGLSAGRRPPSNAEIATATVTVASGVSAQKTAESFAALAESLAAAYVEWLFPPERTHTQLRDSRTAPETTDRYRSVAETLGADLGESIETADARAANRRLTDALVARLGASLRSRFDTTEQAAAHCSVERVELVARRWEP